MKLCGLWALVPLKNLRRGKERLAPALGVAERRDLIDAMARDVIEALRSLPLEPGRIVLVSDDEEVAVLAAQYGVGIYRPSRVATDPLNAALAEALEHVREQGAVHALVMHADLPLASAAELRRMLAMHAHALACGGAPLLTLVTDRAGEGTNCLLGTPPGVIACRFGADSRSRHHQAARAAGVPCNEFAGDGLGRDIDQPGDLAELVALCQSAENVSGAHTVKLLRGRSRAGGSHAS